MPSNVVPVNDYLIVQVIPNAEKTQGGILLPGKVIEESYTGVVVHANPVSYYRNGELREPICKKGDTVVFAKKSGTDVVHAPDGLKWLAIPEDCIYYKITEG